jgi:HTH-type transcriptional regulator/antitoxin HigA
MKTSIVKYSSIKNREQYNQYCKQLEVILMQEGEEQPQYQIDLLTKLIEDYDKEHTIFKR